MQTVRWAHTKSVMKRQTALLAMVTNLLSCGYYKFVTVKIEQNIMHAGFNLSFPFDGNILNVVLCHTKQSNNTDLEQLHVKYC